MEKQAIQKLNDVFDAMRATEVGQEVLAGCPKCGRPLTVMLTIPAEYQVIERVFWNKEKGKWEKNNNFLAGKMVSQLKELKAEDNSGELDIYCECGWFYEERSGGGKTK